MTVWVGVGSGLGKVLGLPCVPLCPSATFLAALCLSQGQGSRGR